MEIACSSQASLFENTAITTKLSNSEKVRFPLINSFNKLCKDRALTVSLDSTKGFKTYDPSKPINFWLYRPQHILDKAPIFNSGISGLISF